MATTTASQSYADAVAKGKKVYNRKSISDRCDAQTRVHSECPGTYFGFQSYVVPTQFRCSCKCHTPTATCKRCGMTGLAWAETFKFGRTAWSLYQPVDHPTNSTYRLEHRCGVDRNAEQDAVVTRESLFHAERTWLREERRIARMDGNDTRMAGLTAYSTILNDLMWSGGQSFDEVVGSEVLADDDIIERARALYEAGKEATA